MKQKQNKNYLFCIQINFNDINMDECMHDEWGCISYLSIDKLWLFYS